MYYFNSNSQDKRLPKKGSIIYIIPIRYWEIEEYKPEKFIVEKAYKQKTDGRMIIYGLFEKENDSMYAAINYDSEWYWSYYNALKAQKLFSKIYKIISKDDSDYVVEKIMKDMKL